MPSKTATRTPASQQPQRRATQRPAAGTNAPSNRRAASRSIAQSLQEYGRGIAGGILFSLPLLYTMEVWWAGFSIHPWRLIGAVLATLVLLLGYNRYAGLRSDASMLEVLIDSVEELGIGLVVSTIVLWMLGRVRFDMPANEIAGKIIVESLVVAIGVSVGTAQLSGGDDEGDEDSGMDGSDGTAPPKGEEQTAHGPSVFIGQLVLTFCGAILIAANIAPTEEIIMLAVEIAPWRLIGLAIVSMLLSTLILYFSDFKSAQKLAPAESYLGIFSGAVITYMVALVASAALLWFFGSFDGFAPITCLAATVVLSVAAVLGASAGRLLLQANSQG
jgi:putative integral membrane protein (TIGR02587 family)